MNNQEAIVLLRNLEDSLDSYCELNEEGKTAFRMAINALNCSEIPNSSDTISRQRAIDALKTDMASLDHIIKSMSAYDVRLDAYVSQRNQVDCDIDTISNLPSVQPKIIRCKDCLIHGVCRFEQGLGLNGYCSQAKRRTNG